MIVYVCAFAGPTCFRSSRHDSVRDHCRKSPRHRRAPPADKKSATEHLPWMISGNDRYKPMGDVPPLPRDPQTRRELSVIPRPLPFAGQQVEEPRFCAGA